MFLNRQSPKKCIANNYILTLVHYANSQGLNSDELLLESGISLSHLKKKRGYTSFDQYVAFIHAFLSRCYQPKLAFDIIRRVEITEHGLLGLAVLCGLNLEQALKIVMKFSKLQSNLLDISLIEYDDMASILMQPNYQMDQAVYEFVIELTLGTFYKSKQDITGKITRDHIICVNYPANGKRSAFQDFFGDHVEFDAGEVSFSFPKPQLHDKLQLANTKAHEMMVEACEKNLSSIGNTDVVSQVRALLKQSESRFPSQDDIAEQLHLSSRSLRRHLQSHKISYQQLLDMERIDRAKNLLQYSDLSITTIGLQVGYSDAANFSKAFKKLTDMSPSQYRQSLESMT